MGTIANVIVGVATLYYGTAGALVASITSVLGYTEDGVTFEYTPTVSDIEVEEETIAINRVLTKEEITVTCNMAESAHVNLLNAMAGAASSGGGTIITLGDGILQKLGIKIIGDNPNGAGKRTIYIPYVNPVGTVGMSYKKGTKTIVPVSFKAYKGGATVCTITDAA